MELNKEIDNKLGFGYGNMGLGTLRMLRGDYDGALEYLKKAQRMFERVGSKVMATEVKMNLFELAIKRGDIKEAERLESTLKRVLASGSYPWKEFFFLNRVKLHMLKGAVGDEDIENLKVVIDAARKAPGDIYLLEGFSLMVRILRSRGKYEEAEAYLKEGLKILSKVLRNIPKGFMRERFLEKEEVQSLIALKKELNQAKSKSLTFTRK